MPADLHPLLEEILGLVVVVAAVAALARRLRVVSPILLVLAGLGLSTVPGVPDYRLNPELVLLFFLPPLLYAAAIRTSLPAFRANVRPIALLSIGLVVFTTLVVALVVTALLPGLPFPAALALGAIVAPPDAVAATAIARRSRLPRRVVTVLEGESLLNDATALVAYRMTVAAVTTGAVSILTIGGRFLLAAVGGVAVGLAVAWVVSWLLDRIEDPVLDTTLSLLSPFLSFVPAERIGSSGVVAVVVTGLVLGHRAPLSMTARSRLLSESLWSMIQFLLEGAVFVLIGLQLTSVLESLVRYPAGLVVWATAGVVLAVVLSRFAWVFPATYVTRLIPRVRERDPSPSWRFPAVISWAGMRGVVSLAAAAALPEDFPERALLVFLAFAVVVATLVVQGLTLPWLIRRLRLPPPDAVQDALQEAAVQHEASAASRQRLDELLTGQEEGAVALPAGVEERLREKVDQRGLSAWERLGSRDRETPTAAFRRLRREMLEVERSVFIRARDEGRLEQEVLQQVLRDLDLEESMLFR